MGNTHLTVQGTMSYAKHAVCAKVGIEGAWKAQAETLPGALLTFPTRMNYLDSTGEKQPAPARSKSPALQTGEQVLSVHTREVQVYPAPAICFPAGDQSHGQWPPALAGRSKHPT